MQELCSAEHSFCKVAHFAVNLNANSRNNRYHCSENPNTFHDIHLHDLILFGVWCVVSCEGTQNHRVFVI
jgi:hypothetical protein